MPGAELAKPYNASTTTITSCRSMMILDL